jgi:hypothetical protein
MDGGRQIGSKHESAKRQFALGMLTSVGGGWLRIMSRLHRFSDRRAHLGRVSPAATNVPRRAHE